MSCGIEGGGNVVTEIRSSGTTEVSLLSVRVRAHFRVIWRDTSEVSERMFDFGTLFRNSVSERCIGTGRPPRLRFGDGCTRMES